jgi:hypothetical protein
MVPGAQRRGQSHLTIWKALSYDDYGTSDDYARKWLPVGANLARMWQRAFDSYYRTLKGAEFGEWFRTFYQKARTKSWEISSFTYHAIYP